MTKADNAVSCQSSLHENGLTFFWNGKRYPARLGDTIAIALWRQGVRTLGCSRKRHRNLGLSGSYLQGILVTVSGRPNSRADEVLVSEGLDARQQNVWPSARWDVLRMFRFVPARWIRGGFEHPRLLPGGTLRARARVNNTGNPFPTRASIVVIGAGIQGAASRVTLTHLSMPGPVPLSGHNGLQLADIPPVTRLRVVGDRS
jgi:hypothetical protein